MVIKLLKEGDRSLKKDWFFESVTAVDEGQAIASLCVEPGAGFPELTYILSDIIIYPIAGDICVEDVTPTDDFRSPKKAQGEATVHPGQAFVARGLSDGLFMRETNRGDAPCEYIRIHLKKLGGNSRRWRTACDLESRRQGALAEVCTLGDSEDGAVFAAMLNAGDSVVHELPTARAWVHVIAGSVDVNDKSLAQGDGAAVAADDTDVVLLLSNAGSDPAHLLVIQFPS